MVFSSMLAIISQQEGIGHVSGRMTMKTYTVQVRLFFEIEVDATNEEEASAMAIEATIADGDCFDTTVIDIEEVEGE